VITSAQMIKCYIYISVRITVKRIGHKRQLIMTWKINMDAIAKINNRLH